MPQTESLNNGFERLSRSAREVQERWLASLQVAANGPWLRQAEQGYHGQLDTAQSWVDQSLRLQNKFLEDCRQALEGLPAAQARAASDPDLSNTLLANTYLEWAEQATARRAALWQHWFEAARKVDFSAAGDLIDDARSGRDVMSSLSKLSQRALEQQAELLGALFAQPAAAEAEEALGITDTSETEAPSVKARPAARAAARAAEA